MGPSENAQQKSKTFFASRFLSKYKKGEILIRSDEQPSSVFYLKEGVVKMYSISEKGEEIVLNIFKPGSFFPMSWAINDSQNIYFFEATTDLDTHKVPKDDVVNFVKENSDVQYDLLSRVYSGLDGMLVRMSHLMSGTARTRLISEIVITAQRFGEMQAGRIVSGVSVKELALRTGLTKETVSREMSSLKKEGHVSYKSRKLEVFDLMKLKSEL